MYCMFNSINEESMQLIVSIYCLDCLKMVDRAMAYFILPSRY